MIHIVKWFILGFWVFGDKNSVFKTCLHVVLYTCIILFLRHLANYLGKNSKSWSNKGGLFSVTPPPTIIFLEISENIVANKLENKPESFSFNFILREIV